MAVKVRIPTPLRNVTGGVSIVDVEPSSVSGVIGELEVRYPAIKGRLRDDSGELRRFVNVYLNGEDIRFLQGLETSVSEGDEVSIVPAVAGG
jgi:sulfur-carrier protein